MFFVCPPPLTPPPPCAPVLTSNSSSFLLLLLLLHVTKSNSCAEHTEQEEEACMCQPRPIYFDRKTGEHSTDEKPGVLSLSWYGQHALRVEPSASVRVRRLYRLTEDRPSEVCCFSSSRLARVCI